MVKLMNWGHPEEHGAMERVPFQTTLWHINRVLRAPHVRTNSPSTMEYNVSVSAAEKMGTNQKNKTGVRFCIK